MRPTWPTWTPRIFTFAPASMTRPARSEVKVTGIVGVNSPANSAMLKKIRPAIVTNRIAVHHNGCTRCSTEVRAMDLSGHVEVAGAPVDGERNEQDDHR